MIINESLDTLDTLESLDTLDTLDAFKGLKGLKGLMDHGVIGMSPLNFLGNWTTKGGCLMGA